MVKYITFSFFLKTLPYLASSLESLLGNSLDKYIKKLISCLVIPDFNKVCFKVMIYFTKS